MDVLLLEPTHKIDPINSDGLDPVIANDRELNGEINRASTQGAKFVLLLAMLEENNLHRPVLHDSPSVELDKSESSSLHYYRSPPLLAESDNWQTLQQTSILVNSGHIQTAHLWLAMHPEPLSQYNNALHLDEDVLANCSLPTQTRLQQDKANNLNVDETVLFDILQEMESNAA